ncbi:hypothetical protein [Dyadobacter bucti]|uniref:hypothetical protein n=1 Tax=Dyadobacter bucti TaxID=2572203 RepID=UPI0011099D4E|nr:hypothetical protein [Dyadobacter bucti]
MKKIVLTVFAQICIFCCAHAQSTEQFKLDSTALSQQKIILELQKQILDIKQAQIDYNKTSESSDFKTEIDKVKAYKEILGDSKPEALSGNITVSEGKVSSAETRSLVHDALKTGILEIQKDIKVKRITDIVIYNSPYFRGIPQYSILKSNLELLKRSYDQFNTSLTGVTRDAAFLTTLAAGIAVVNAIGQLGTLFKTETSIVESIEYLNESLVVAKLANGLDANYYYPALYPISSSGESEIAKLLIQIENIRLTITGKLDDTQTAINTLDQEVAKKEAEITTDNSKLTKAKSQKNQLLIKSLELSIKVKSTEVEQLKAARKPLLDKLTNWRVRFESIDKDFAKVKEKLEEIIDKENNLSALAISSQIEQIIKKISAGAKTLRITTKAISTNKITKFLWISTLKSTAAVEIEYLIFDSDGKIIASNTFLDYKGKRN